KLPTPDSDLVRAKPGYMADRARQWFADTKYAADADRADRLAKKWSGAVEAASAGESATYDKMVADAKAKWPKIPAEFSPATGFKPADADKFKGKVIKLTGRNRIGWDYGADQYNFAVTIDGVAVAGKYDDEVKKAVEAAKKATGRDLPEEEDYEVFAVV